MNKEFFRIPAPVDGHVHLRDMGQNKKEDFYTGTSAALAGGYTTILDMPNKQKAIFTLDDLLEEIETAKPKIVCDVGFYFGTDGKNSDEFKRVKGKTPGLKVYLNETTGNLKIALTDLRKIYIAWPQDAGPILLHAELEAVPFSLGIVEEIRRKTHYCHVSTKKDLELIIEAKRKGLPITCGVTPHHLFLTKDDIKKLGAFAEMKPPLGTQEDVDFLWKNLRFIDVIESDHAPHTIEEKQSQKPPSGVPGLETTLPLMLTAVSQKRLILERLIELISTNPQKIFGIKIPESTFTEVDLDETYLLSNRGLKTKCGWTPFAEREVAGRVNRVFIRGEKVFEDGEILAKQGSGRIILSDRQ